MIAEASVAAPIHRARRATARTRTTATARHAGVEALNAGPRVRGQAALAGALNRAPAVAQLAARGASLATGRLPADAPVQRVGRGTTGALGLAAGGYLGGYLDAFLPYRLGSIGGALAGGALGLAAPYLVRYGLSTRLAPESVRSGAFWGEINQEGEEARTVHTPQSMADRLAVESPAFGRLRGDAEGAVREVYDRDLGYVSKTRSYGGSYGEGQVNIDTDQHPAVALGNVVFETANAAQSRFIARVRADHGDGALARNPLSHYAELLGRDASEMDALREEYDEGDPITRRVLLQEWAEYNSLQLARDSLTDIQGRLSGKTAGDLWDKALWDELLRQKTFQDDYEFRGEDHRRPVENALREAAQKRN